MDALDNSRAMKGSVGPASVLPYPCASEARVGTRRRVREKLQDGLKLRPRAAVRSFVSPRNTLNSRTIERYAPVARGMRVASMQRTRQAARFNPLEVDMLYYAIVFFVIALVAALFGFGGIAAGAAGIAKILFFAFLIIAIVTFLMSLARRG